MSATRKGWIVLGLLCGGIAVAHAEELTFTTYYPAPPAGASSLRADDLAVGRTYRSQTPPPDGAIIEGPVGIGTTDPGVLLVGAKVGLEVANGPVRISARHPALPTLQYQWSPPGARFPMHWQTGIQSDEAFYVWRVGALGNALRIAPTYDADLQGSPLIDIGPDSRGRKRVFIDTNVGIGTTHPALLLDVNGAAIVGGTTGRSGSLNVRGGGPGRAEGGQVILNAAGDGTPGERPNSWSLDNVNGNLFRIFYGSAAFGNAVEALAITSGGNVGIGTTTPSRKLHVAGDMQLTKSGDPTIFFEVPNAQPNQSFWAMGPRSFGPSGEFSIVAWDQNRGVGLSVIDIVLKPGSNEVDHTLLGGRVGIGTVPNPNAKLDVNGAIYQRGGVLHADYVFTPGYRLESIEEHAAAMWAHRRLPALPPGQRDAAGQQVVELGAQSRGTLEELEKAHLYIAQLHERLAALEARLRRLEAD